MIALRLQKAIRFLVLLLIGHCSGLLSGMGRRERIENLTAAPCSQMAQTAAKSF